MSATAIDILLDPDQTLGLADDLEDLVAKPFDGVPVRAVSAAIYQLGDLGTAQKLLWSSAEGGRQ